MSTPAIVSFGYEPEDLRAHVYTHWDGDPASMLPALDEFFRAVADQCKDTRFGDPAYLAAKYVVWQASQNPYPGVESPQPLNFLGVGIVADPDSWSVFRYVVVCPEYGTVPEVLSLGYEAGSM